MLTEDNRALPSPKHCNFCLKTYKADPSTIMLLNTSLAHLWEFRVCPFLFSERGALHEDRCSFTTKISATKNTGLEGTGDLLQSLQSEVTTNQTFWSQRSTNNIILNPFPTPDPLQDPVPNSKTLQHCYHLPQEEKAREVLNQHSRSLRKQKTNNTQGPVQD